MSEAPLSPNEQERLQALHSYAVLDSEAEEQFDELVRLASLVCETPIALISLVDETRQWFKARVGLAASQTPREHAFCAHAILGDDTMIVPDATRDDRFSDNPLVLEDPKIRFYAGAPLRTPEGHTLGTLCVIDSSPRDAKPLRPHQLEALDTLSRQAVRLLEYRRVSAQLADALSRIKVLSPLVPVCAWCNRFRSDEAYWASVAEYLKLHAGVELTHGICPSCEAKLEQKMG